MRYFRILLAVIALTGVTLTVIGTPGCSSVQGFAGQVAADAKTHPLAAQTVVQYGVLKTIEDSKGVTAQGVYDTSQKVRGYVEKQGQVALNDVVAQAQQYIPMDSLQPSDRLLVTALLQQIQYSVQEALPAKAGPDNADKVAILTVLDWADQAAVMAGAVPNASQD